jgi:hypothetical protein
MLQIQVFPTGSFPDRLILAALSQNFNKTYVEHDNTFDSLNCLETPTIDRHFETFTFDLFRITFMRLIAIYQVSITTDTNIIMFSFFLTIFINMS